MEKLKDYTPTEFMSPDSHYDKSAADYACQFIEALCHTKGMWAGKPFELIPWQEKIIRDVFGTIKPNGYRQFTQAYIEIPKKQGKSELAAAVALSERKITERNGTIELAEHIKGQIEEVKANMRPRVVATSVNNIIEEFFATNEGLDAHVEGRIEVVE